MRIIARFFLLLIALIIGGVALLSIRPDLLPIPADWLLQDPFAQIIAMRGMLAVGIFAASIVFAFFALIRHFMSRKGRIAALLAVLLFAAVIGQGIVLWHRGIHTAAEFPKLNSGSITVLTYNTQGGQTTNTDLLSVIKQAQADIVVLPETSGKRGAELQQLLMREGKEYQYFDTHTSPFQPEFSSTILLVSYRLGEYELDKSSSYAEGELSLIKVHPVFDPVASTAAQRSRPVIIATHPIAPIPDMQGRWRKEITAVYENCQSENNFIMAGDFNSTIDHQYALGAKCQDAAKEADSGALGTWRADMPALLASPIDRVLHSGKYYRGVATQLLEVGNSDHRGLLVRLELKDTKKN